MQCPKCRKTVNVLDTACGSCGASLILLERSAELSGPVDSLLDQSSRLLDSELTRLDDELNREWAKETTANGSTLTGAEYKKFAALDRPDHSFLQMNGREILVTSKEDVLQIGGFVFHSPMFKPMPCTDSGQARPASCSWRMNRRSTPLPLITVIPGLILSRRLLCCSAVWPMRAG